MKVKPIVAEETWTYKTELHVCVNNIIKVTLYQFEELALKTFIVTEISSNLIATKGVTERMGVCRPCKEWSLQQFVSLEYE